jgi:hypothetical protein
MKSGENKSMDFSAGLVIASSEAQFWEGDFGGERGVCNFLLNENGFSSDMPAFE